MAAFAEQVASRELPEGSMAAGILEAVARGDLSAGQCPMAIIDYLGPSLDTTISGLGNAVWLFATHPEQWQRLREDPGRAKQAFDEAIRLESPVTGFTRVTTRAAEIGEVELPAGSRVLVSYASANRDERYWDAPERFDIERSNASHVAFGFGEHTCAGMGLARLEATAVLTALARRVERFELAGPPVRKLNNVIRAFGSLPVRVIPAAATTP
jgi:cytochrome P450